MPLHPEHEKKKYKNYTLLAVLVGVMALFFVLTIIKIKAAGERNRAKHMQQQEQVEVINDNSQEQQE